MSKKQKDKEMIPAEPQNALETEIEKVKQGYLKPDIFIAERQKLKEYNELLNIKKSLTAAQDKRKKEVELELAMLYGLENGIWSTSLSWTKYAPTLTQLRKSVVKDYSCQTSLELMLADRIVSHYWRAMRSDSILNMLIEEKDGGYSFNQQKINAINSLHRGVELADRQLNADIILLKELKQPKLNIKVNTENAYIAQNQQINTSTPANPTFPNKNENNEPK